MKFKVSITVALTITAIVAALLLLKSYEPQRTMTVGVHPWIGYETLYLAKQFGWLDGKAVLVENNNAQVTLLQLKEKKIDAGALTLDEVLLACSMGLDLQVVAVLDVSAGADAVLAKSGVTLGTLKGKRIAHEDAALGDFMMDQLLRSQHLEKTDVIALNIPPAKQVEAFQTDKADVFITYEPYVSQLRHVGLHQLYSTKELADTVFDVLVVRKEVLPYVKDSLGDLLGTQFKTLRYIQRNRDDAAYRLSGLRGITLKEVNHALGGIKIPTLANNRRMLHSGSQMERVTTSLHAIMQKGGLLKSERQCTVLFTNAYLPSEVQKP